MEQVTAMMVQYLAKGAKNNNKKPVRQAMIFRQEKTAWFSKIHGPRGLIQTPQEEVGDLDGNSVISPSDITPSFINSSIKNISEHGKKLNTFNFILTSFFLAMMKTSEKWEFRHNTM